MRWLVTTALLPAAGAAHAQAQDPARYPAQNQAMPDMPGMDHAKMGHDMSDKAESR
jgi:hypothetical protein